MYSVTNSYILSKSSCFIFQFFLSGEGESIFKPYNFRMEEIEGFRYRAKDAMRAVTRTAVREARLKEIKAELLNSQKLKVCTAFYFHNFYCCLT